MIPKRKFNGAAAARIPQAALNALFTAAARGDARAVRETLAEYPGAIHGRLHGKTALQVAVEKNQVPVITALLQAKAGPDAMSDDGMSSPVIAAAAADNTMALILLIHGGARLYMPQGGSMTPLLAAVRNESVKSIPVLLKHGASHRAFDDEGNAALHAATSLDKLKAAKALLENGADINQRNREELTPLMLAAQERNLPAAKFLLENGADYMLLSDLRETALDIARAYAGGDGKFLKGYEALMAARLRAETKEYLPEFRKGTHRQVAVKRPARFRPQ